MNKNVLFLLALLTTVWIQAFSQQTVRMAFPFVGSAPTYSANGPISCGVTNGLLYVTTDHLPFKANGTQVPSSPVDAIFLPANPGQAPNDLTSMVHITFPFPVNNLKVHVSDLDEDASPSSGPNFPEETITQVGGVAYSGAFMGYTSRVVTAGAFLPPNIFMNDLRPDSIGGNNSAAWMEFSNPGISEISFEYSRITGGVNYAMLIDSIVFDCPCFAEGSSEFAQINVPTTYDLASVGTTVKVWTGSTYVSEDVVVDGITLDVTQADIVFAPCTRITLKNGAMLRANNSTFRTCFLEESWEGIHFTSNGSLSTSAIINECTFKNAASALTFASAGSGLASYDATITTNSFVDCLTGISIPGSSSVDMAGSITGNTFTVNEREINWRYSGVDGNGRCSAYLSKQYVGIGGSKVGFSTPISQNDFVNASQYGGTGATSSLVGILLREGNADISLNNFTNNLHAVQMMECNRSNIENNRMEITHAFSPSETQILAYKGKNVWVMGNHLVNSTESYQFNLLGAAISMERCTMANVKENDVDGFSNGIQFYFTSSSAITENRVSNSNSVGILVDGGEMDSISCNDVRMHLQLDPNQASTGIALVHLDETNSTVVIKGNCVKDAAVAIAVSNMSGVVSRVPRIYNNYLYNYVRAGVWSAGFDGSQGSGSATSAEASRNTFASNHNLPGAAFDIMTNGMAQDWYGSFGATNNDPAVTQYGPDLYYSIASCGHQMGTQASMITEMEVCDFFGNNLPGGIHRIQQGDYHDLEQYEDKGSFAAIAELTLRHLFAMGDEDAAVAFKSWLGGRNSLTSAEQAWMDFVMAEEQEDVQGMDESIAALVQLDPSNAEFGDIHAVIRKLAQSNKSISDLDSSDIHLLERVAQSNGQWVDAARAVLHMADRNHPHLLKPIPVFDYSRLADYRSLNSSEQMLTLFPNPSNGMVTIEYVVPEATGSELRVCDATGKMILSQQLSAEVSSMQVDLSFLQPGIYLVSIHGEQGLLESAKLSLQR